MSGGLISMMLQTAAALAAVLGVFALVVWAMKRFQFRLPQQAKNLRMVQRLNLDHHSSIVEICHGQKHYLLAISQANITIISPDQSFTSETVTLEPTGCHVDSTKSGTKAP